MVREIKISKQVSHSKASQCYIYRFEIALICYSQKCKDEAEETHQTNKAIFLLQTSPDPKFIRQSYFELAGRDFQLSSERQSMGQINSSYDHFIISSINDIINKLNLYFKLKLISYVKYNNARMIPLSSYTYLHKNTCEMCPANFLTSPAAILLIVF